MKKRLTTLILFSAIAAVAVFGCDDAGFLASQGDNPDDSLDIPQKSDVSDCGGFDANPSALTLAKDGSSDDYCDAELIVWEYDAETQTLTVIDQRSMLNCCGEREMTIEELGDGTYLITEDDDPEALGNGETSRCHCTCAFDLKVTANDIPEADIAVKIVLDEEEADAVETVWEGTLALSEGAGEIVANEDDTMGMCEPI